MNPLTTYEELRAVMLEWRYIKTPCPECGGSGVKVYGDTSTYHHGGIAGQAMTVDVCDVCWGSGDANKPWPSHLLLKRGR